MAYECELKTPTRGPRRYTVVDLFCGCGGLSYGFKRSGRFDIVLGNDVKKAALRTFKLNLADGETEPIVLDCDIREVPVDTISDALAARGVGDVGDLDCLVGGPPCQGFSQLRRSEERVGNEIVRFRGYNRLLQDPRNDLVLRFLEIASVLRPKFVLIENVPQILRHGHAAPIGPIATSVVSLLEDMGYSVAIRTLNAADYGVPQLRERVFFLASRVGPASFPPASHRDPAGHTALVGASPWVTVREAIGDLPPPPAGRKDTLGGGPLGLYLDVSLSDYAAAMRSHKAFPYNHVTRRYDHRVMSIIREMRPGETWDEASERMRRNYERLIRRLRLPGEELSDAVQRLSDAGVINRAFYRRYYWSAYTRLSWDRPALTITANANFLGSGRFTHPTEDRGITMREAARLQSFDDDFRFITSATDDDDTATIGVGMDMIGEAVPPLLAEAIARHIASMLDEASGVLNTDSHVVALNASEVRSWTPTA